MKMHQNRSMEYAPAHSASNNVNAAAKYDLLRFFSKKQPHQTNNMTCYGQIFSEEAILTANSQDIASRAMKNTSSDPMFRRMDPKKSSKRILEAYTETKTRHGREKETVLTLNTGASKMPRMKKIEVYLNKKRTYLLCRDTRQSFDEILCDIGDMFQVKVDKMFTINGSPVLGLSGLLNGPDKFIVKCRRKSKPLKEDPPTRAAAGKISPSLEDMRDIAPPPFRPEKPRRDSPQSVAVSSPCDDIDSKLQSERRKERKSERKRDLRSKLRHPQQHAAHSYDTDVTGTSCHSLNPAIDRCRQTAESQDSTDISPSLSFMKNLASLSTTIKPEYAVASGVKWSSDTSGNGSGYLRFPEAFSGSVPVYKASTINLSYFRCHVMSENARENFQPTNQHTLHVLDFYPTYFQEFVLNTRYLNGAGLERQNFSHSLCPMKSESGVLVLAKFVSVSELHITGFQVPKNSTVYIPGGVIYSHDYLLGKWRILLSDDASIDHVHLMKINGANRGRNSYKKFYFHFV